VFLEALAKDADVSNAAKRAGVGRTTAYEHRDKERTSSVCGTRRLRQRSMRSRLSWCAVASRAG